MTTILIDNSAPTLSITKSDSSIKFDVVNNIFTNSLLIPSASKSTFIMTTLEVKVVESYLFIASTQQNNSTNFEVAVDY